MSGVRSTSQFPHCFDKRAPIGLARQVVHQVQVAWGQGIFHGLGLGFLGLGSQQSDSGSAQPFHHGLDAGGHGFGGQGTAGMAARHGHPHAAAVGCCQRIYFLARYGIRRKKGPKVHEVQGAEPPASGPAEGQIGPGGLEGLPVGPRVPVDPLRLEQGRQGEIEAGKVEIVHGVEVKLLEIAEGAAVLPEYFPQSAQNSAGRRSVGPDRMDMDMGKYPPGQIRQGAVQTQMHLVPRPGRRGTQQPLALEQVAESGQLDDEMPSHGQWGRTPAREPFPCGETTEEK